jgi:LPS-assembly lipoprotein
MLTRRYALAGSALGVALALQGCGFTPIYARGTQASDLLSQIEVAPIAERSGQILRNHLVDMFEPRRGSAARRQYVLQVRIIESRAALAIRRDDVISRGGYSASANFRIVDRAGRQIMTGAAGFNGDFEISDSERATAMAREGTRDRLMQLLAEEIRLQIATQLPSLNPPQARSP